MPIWTTTSIEVTPELVLVTWRILETDRGERHFVGYNLTESEGRVSSAIVEFDPATMTGKTLSGRIYRLAGRPGIDPDGDYVWRAWCRANGVETWLDVTGEVL